MRSVLKQVYGNASAVDDELVQTLLQPGQDDGAEEVFLKVLRAPAGPSPESILPNIQVPIIAIWGEGTCIRTHPSLAPHCDLPLTSLAHAYHLGADDPWTPLTTGMHPGAIHVNGWMCLSIYVFLFVFAI